MRTLSYILYVVIQILDFLILVRCLMSFFVRSENKFTSFVYTVTEPILGPLRALLDKTPLGGMMLDFSPVLAILLLNMLSMLLI